MSSSDYSKTFTCMDSLNFQSSPRRQYYHCFLTNKESSCKEVNNFPKFALVVGESGFEPRQSGSLIHNGY